jgi:hypothetical protein
VKVNHRAGTSNLAAIGDAITIGWYREPWTVEQMNTQALKVIGVNYLIIGTPRLIPPTLQTLASNR